MEQLNMKHLHSISHIEIPAPDFTSAIEFYKAVFNWGIELVTVGHYAFFTIGNTGAGGAFNSALMPAPEGTGLQVMIYVDSIDETVKSIEANGGKIIKARTEIPGGHGFYAVFTDTNSNYMQIHSMQ